MALPKPPFQYSSLTDRDGLTLAPGSFYGWEVGGALLSASAPILNPTRYSDLPGNLVRVTGGTYVLPPYVPLSVNRERFAANGDSVAFWFVILNDGVGVITIVAGSGWTLQTFQLDIAKSMVVVVLDSGLDARGYYSTPYAAVAGAVSSVASGSVGAESGTSELSFMPDPIVGVGSIALAASGVGAGPFGTPNSVPTLTFSAGGRVLTCVDTPIDAIALNTTTPLSGGGLVTPGNALTFSLDDTAVVPATYGDATHVGAFTVDAKGRLTSASSVAITGSSLGSITVTPTAPISVGGSPVSLGGTLTITHDNTAVTPGTYVAASLTVDAKGHLTAAGNSSARSLAAGTGISLSGGTTNFYANSSVAATIALANTAVVAGSYGSSTSVGTFTVDAQGRLTAAASVAISGSSLGSITVTGAGPLTVGGSPVTLGGTLTLTNTALDSIATRNWKAGSSAAITAANTDAVVVGDSAKGSNFSVCLGSKAGTSAVNSCTMIGYNAGGNGSVNFSGCVVIGDSAATSCTSNVSGVVVIGYVAGANLNNCSGNVIVGSSAGAGVTTGGGNVLVGANTNASVGTINNAIAIGESAVVASTTAIAIGNTALGQGTGSITIGDSLANANGTGAISIGSASSAAGTNCIAIGQGSSNSTANTALIGTGTGFIVKSPGFFQSNTSYSCQAGRSSGTQTVTFPGPVTLTIANTAWDNIGSAVSGNNILAPLANTHFRVSANVVTNAVVSPTLGTVLVRIRYYNGTTTATIAVSDITTFATTGAETGWSLTGEFTTPGVTSAYAFVEMERTAGSTTSMTVSSYELTVCRVV